MDTGTVDTRNTNFKSLLTINSPPESFDAPASSRPSDAPAANRPSPRSPDAAPSPRSQDAAPAVVERLPRGIPGGFHAVSDELANRAREWRNMSRLLNQQGPQLEAAEIAFDGSLHSLRNLVPVVEESSRSLLTLLKSTRDGTISEDLSDRFVANLKTLEGLEDAAASLVTDLISIRSVWEQYAATVLKGQKMRDQISSGSKR